MSPALFPQLFDSYVELHTVQLGVLLGLFVGLFYRDHPYLAYALLFLGVFFGLVNASHIGFLPDSDVATEIEARPGYFLGGIYVTAVVNIVLVTHWEALRLRAGRLFRTVENRTDSVTFDGTGSKD